MVQRAGERPPEARGTEAKRREAQGALTNSVWNKCAISLHRVGVSPSPAPRRKGVRQLRVEQVCQLNDPVEKPSRVAILWQCLQNSSQTVPIYISSQYAGQFERSNMA